MLTSRTQKVQSPSRRNRWRRAGAVLCLLLCAASRGSSASAQQALPDFGDPAVGRTRPELDNRTVIRFLTSADWPPFQFVRRDGTPAGFNVDLAQALCDDLKIACTLQARPWSELLPALAAGRADAVIAGLKPTAALRRQADLTATYLRLPARFAVARGSALGDVVPETLAGHTVAAVAKSAHAAYLRAFFPKSTLETYPDETAAFAALKQGKVDALFGDGVAIARWLAGTASASCCRFAGGPYMETHFFGGGMVIAVRKGDDQLRAALDHALSAVETHGTLSELYLRWFPLPLFETAGATPH